MEDGLFQLSPEEMEQAEQAEVAGSEVQIL